MTNLYNLAAAFSCLFLPTFIPYAQFESYQPYVVTGECIMCAGMGRAFQDSGDDAAGERVVPMDVPVTVVEQDLDEHFFGPTYTTRAIIHRDIDEPLGLVLLSALDAAVQGVTGKVSQGTGGQTHPSGTRIGKIKPNSPVAKSNCVHVGDQIVSINGANMMNMRHEEVRCGAIDLMPHPVGLY